MSISVKTIQGKKGKYKEQYINAAGKTLGYFEEGVFTKPVPFIERKHLLWSKGGVPAIDATVWESVKDKVHHIEITTDKKRIFYIAGKLFDDYKQSIDFGYGKQYFVRLEHWKITQVAPSLW